MSPQTPESPLTTDPALRAVRIPASLYVSAAERLVQVSGADRERASRRFVAAAPTHGIDLSLMWGTIGAAARGRGNAVRQACLVVLGAGRTAMVFVSARTPEVSERPADAQERVLAVEAALRYLSENQRDSVRIAQALLEPHEFEAESALRANAFFCVGDLAYLRASIDPGSRPPPQEPWPHGIEVRSMIGSERGNRDRALLASALERSYEATRDCPELCGLRETDDVIDSHLATGAWRAPLWRLVLAGGEPQGCMLLNHCPDQECVELVYLGLAPGLRGRGLGRGLLALGIRDAVAVGARGMTCAVDRRNTAALGLYAAAGFRECGGRRAMVRPLPPTGATRPSSSAS